jgi:hypothetical protein
MRWQFRIIAASVAALGFCLNAKEASSDGTYPLIANSTGA